MLCVVSRVLHRLDGLMKTVATEAVEATQVVCLAQNAIRRKFVSDLKRSMSDALQVKKDWQQCIVQLTHERSAPFMRRLTPSTPAVSNYCCSKCSAPYWSDPPFLPERDCSCLSYRKSVRLSSVCLSVVCL